MNIYFRHWTILPIPKASTRWCRNWKALLHERGWVKSAENLSTSPFKRDLSIVPLSAKQISQDSPFKVPFPSFTKLRYISPFQDCQKQRQCIMYTRTYSFPNPHNFFTFSLILYLPPLFCFHPFFRFFQGGGEGGVLPINELLKEWKTRRLLQSWVTALKPSWWLPSFILPSSRHCDTPSASETVAIGPSWCCDHAILYQQCFESRSIRICIIF